MSRIDFSFGNAISHYSKTGGPGGFLWKYALIFALVTCTLQALAIWLQWPIYEVYIRFFTEGGGDIEPYLDELTAASNQSTLRGLLIMPLSVLVWVAFEGANQRRYMRSEGFRLRIGADEGRLLVVGLIWIAMFIGLYIGLIIAVIIPVVLGLVLGEDLIGVSIIFGVVFMIGVMILALWLCARLSAAAALTVRDQQIRFFESWRVTKGKGWTIVGAWIVLMLIIMLVYLVLYIAAAALGFGLIAAQVPDFGDGRFPEEEIMAAVASPAFWGPMLLVLFAFFLVQAAFQHIISGPAALAARTDEDWAGADLAGEFV